jgi:hypothetical protein
VAKLSVPRLVIVVAVGLVVLAAAVSVVAFGIVPLFVRSTVQEAVPPPGITDVPVSAASAGPVASPIPSVVAAGMLRKVDAVHYGSGQVSILDLTVARYLRFDGVAIAGAPNMFVYLSDRSDGRPGNFTDLGPLKATDGSFNYPLPEGLDLTGVHSVVVWCRAFSVTVTYAELARP